MNERQVNSERLSCGRWDGMGESINHQGKNDAHHGLLYTNQPCESHSRFSFNITTSISKPCLPVRIDREARPRHGPDQTPGVADPCAAVADPSDHFLDPSGRGGANRTFSAAGREHCRLARARAPSHQRRTFVVCPKLLSFLICFGRS